MDHITPVVAVETGFPLTSDGRDDWTTYVERMFVDEPGWQALCKECDKAKMASERELRKYYRALKKKPIAKKKKKEQNIVMLLKDSTDQKSVSHTLLMVTFVACLIASGLECFGVIKTTSILLEMLWGFVALYFGRRFTFAGKQFESNASKEEGNNDESK